MPSIWQTPDVLRLQRRFLPTELPGLLYDDLIRDKDGRLHLPDDPDGNPPSGKGVTLQPGAPRIRILHPDNMPCLVPAMAKVEKMPVDRRGNADAINRVGKK